MFVGVIHNDDYADRPVFEVVQELRKSGPCISVHFEYRQPPLSPKVPRRLLLSSRLSQWRLGREWRAYLGVPSLLTDVKSAGRALASSTMGMSPQQHITLSKAHQVEQFVRTKHLRTWAAFLESNEQVALVLESDALLKPGFSQHLTWLLESRDLQDEYVDVAGGFELDEISASHLVLSRSGPVIRFARPVTNTACAYLLGRRVAERLLRFSKEWKPHVAPGADWYLNAFFMSPHGEVTCEHFDPPILGHGSRMGVTQSWHPDRQ